MRGLLACAAALALGLAACGGGGGGGGGGGAALPGSGAGPLGTGVDAANGTGQTGASGQAGSWLTFSPSPMELDVFLDTPTAFSITATSSKAIPGVFNIGIIDKQGVITTDVRISRFSQLGYLASMSTNRNLAIGLHTGSFEVRLCQDNPLVCAQPLDGSPWQVPYRINVIDPATQGFQRWEVAQSSPGFLNDFALSQRAGAPYVVTAGFSTRVMETWTSADIGTSWTKVSTAHVPALIGGFALASDGNTIYLSGGQGLATSGPRASTGVYQQGVWKFDGNDWQQQPVATAFPARDQHVMAKVGTALYVAGGHVASGFLRDLWRSDDDGINWHQQTDALPVALGRVNCATAWQGSLLLVGSGGVATSADGLTWTMHAALPSRAPDSSIQCGVHNNRLFIISSNLNDYSLSSADLANWQYELSPLFVQFPAPGFASISGRILVVNGQGSSQRNVYRSIP
jgi:hypothetical protein